MAFFNDIQEARPSFFGGIVRFFQNVGSSIDLAASGNARLQQVEALNALTDEELKAKGLRREDIARFVFRDVLHF